MIAERLRPLVGRLLKGVTASYHVYENRCSDEPASIWLKFEGIPAYRVGGASDGWRLILDNEQPKERDMQEYGSMVNCELSARAPFAAVVGRHLEHAWLISSGDGQDVIGVRFDFGASILRIVNWGDELRAAVDLPPDASPGELSERIVV